MLLPVSISARTIETDLAKADAPKSGIGKKHADLLEKHGGKKHAAATDPVASRNPDDGSAAVIPLQG